MSEILETAAIMASNKKQQWQIDDDIKCGVEEKDNGDVAAPPAKVCGLVVIVPHTLTDGLW